MSADAQAIMSRTYSTIYLEYTCNIRKYYTAVETKEKQTKTLTVSLRELEGDQ